MKDKKLLIVKIGGIIASIIGMIISAFVSSKENEKNIKRFVEEKMNESGK